MHTAHEKWSKQDKLVKAEGRVLSRLKGAFRNTLSAYPGILDHEEIKDILNDLVITVQEDPTLRGFIQTLILLEANTMIEY